MRYTKLLIIAFTALLFSCQKNTVDPVTPPSSGLAASTQLNISYGTDPLQKFDAYLPANRSTATTKVLIVIHGGAWFAGDKVDMDTFVNVLKIRLPDYAIFNINYKLVTVTGGNVFPTQENDIKSAVNFIYNNRATYNISDKFALLGASAGAHLALLQAYKNTLPKIKAVVDLYGPTDMADMYNNPASSFSSPTSINFVVTGSIFGSPTSTAANTAIYSSSSPINYVTSTVSPTIIFHGDLDTIVRPAQSITLKNKLIQAGVAYQYKNYPTEGHAYLTAAALNDTFDKTVAFLNQYVQ